MRKILAAAALLAAALVPVLAQSPPGPVPALPDTPRLTSYAITNQTGPFDVGFALYGDGTDYGNWIEVWLDDVKLTPVTQWTLALSSGASLATAARPITNAQITLLSSSTGTLEIVGARRPRRVSQLSENRGVTARDFNQIVTDLVAQNRETWDITSARVLKTPPGENINTLPRQGARANNVLGFDASGNPVALPPHTGDVTPPSVSNNPTPPQGRCTLTSGTPITTTDVTGTTTVFYTPAVGAYAPISLDGATFAMRQFSELSITTSGLAANSVYDLVMWDNSGALALKWNAAWSSDTSRGASAAIEQLAGVWVNTNAIAGGPAARKGTVLCSLRTSSLTQFADTSLFRWVSNIYNAVPRKMKVNDAAVSWAYTTAAFRQANGNAANQFDILQSLSGGHLNAVATSVASNTNTGVAIAAGIGINQNTVNNADTTIPASSPVANFLFPVTAHFNGGLALGRTTAAWLEYSTATGTTTWFGSATPITFPGMTGWVLN